MSFQDKLQQIHDLQDAIQKHGKLSDEVLKKINYKFRLDWNYYSNSMEGNSLTRQETRTVMVGNITVEGKPFQDIMEMRQHDDLITGIIKMGKGDLNISENRIKDIHTAIMYEEDPEKKKQIGHWKKQLNYLTNYRGERFDFAEPADVPDKMHTLVNWLNAEKEKIQRGSKDALHPVFLAFKFHIEYVTIHPFYDGNGRTSRILSNIILISYGYPPMYVKTDERVAYYQYLADIQAYGGNPDLFYDFMAGLVIRSQELVLDAAGGGDIEDEDDLLKEISIWKKQLKVSGFEAKSNARIVELYNLNLGPFIELYRQKMFTAFFELFAEWKELAFVNDKNYNNEDYVKQLHIIEDVYKIVLRTFMNGFKADKTNTFNMQSEISIEFLPFKYVIKINQKILPEKFYNENISLKEQTDIVNDALKGIFTNIKLNMQNHPLSEL